MIKNKKSDDYQLKVFIANRESKCDECGEDLGRHAWIVLRGEKGAACLTCADLDHLTAHPDEKRSLPNMPAESTVAALVAVQQQRSWMSKLFDLP